MLTDVEQPGNVDGKMAGRALRNMHRGLCATRCSSVSAGRTVWRAVKPWNRPGAPIPLRPCSRIRGRYDAIDTAGEEGTGGKACPRA